MEKDTDPNPILQCATANPDGRKRALVIGGGIANFTDVAATFSGIIRALKEKVWCNVTQLAALALMLRFPY